MPTFIEECTPLQIATAKESFDFWCAAEGKTGGRIFQPFHAYGMLGNEQCECSFNSMLKGDDYTAGGAWQWHGSRRDKIFARTGIDVWTASHADQLKAALDELLVDFPTALAEIQATATAASAAAAICKYIEFAGAPNQMVLRGNAAIQWQAYGAAQRWGIAPQAIA